MTFETAVAVTIAHVSEMEREITAAQPEPYYGIVADYEPSLAQVLEHEGGYDNHPADPGGPTNFGITIIDARLYWKPNATAADVKAMPLSVAKAIYKSKYWMKVRGDDLPGGVDYAVFDYGVNSGVSRAIKVMQRCVGAADDGDIGPETLGKVTKADPKKLVNDICDERMTFLKGLKTWATFGRGWTRRVSEVRAIALKMAEKNQPAPAGSWLDKIKGIITPYSTPPAPTVPTKSAWLVWAEKEVGFHEKGNNLGIERYIGFAKCGSLGDPWCSIFCCAALEANGIRGTRSAMARSFEHDSNFVKLPGPALGAIVTMWRGSPSAGTGHVFFYIGENDNGVLALGGNQSDQVCRQYEPRERIVGYYWPVSVSLPKVGKIIVTDKDGHPKGGSEV